MAEKIVMKNFLYFSSPKKIGDDRARTGGLLLAKQMLYQLSYVPGLRRATDRPPNCAADQSGRFAAG